jgi:hypothetical protein
MSKFSGLLERRKTNLLPAPDLESPDLQTSNNLDSQPAGSPVVPSEERPKRPRGKKGDPAYTQVTAYIKTDTYQRTQIRLLQLRGKKKEVSELLQELLTDWLERSGT